MNADKLFEHIKEKNYGLYSIAVIENGCLKKASFVGANNCNNSYSVAKAFTVTAIGMLYDDGKITEDETIYSIFKNKFPKNYDKKWESVTVKNALQHKIGFKTGFLDIDAEDRNDFGSDDFLSLVLSHPLFYNPGENFVYSDAAYYLLSRVVSEKSGERLDDFLLKRLFNPLGFSEIAWSKCPHGYSMGATGLYISSADMVKLGVVYLNYGEYDGKRIVSREWVEKVLENEYEFARHGGGSVYAKGGMNGQMLCFSYNSNTCVAWHAFDRESSCYEILSKLD